MIKISLPIVVEGRHDKAFLSSFLDALIITTDGFGIFSSTQKVEFIRSIAGQRGIIILTDSDNAGMLIRGHLKSMLPNIDIINVYTPEIKGKERRKSAPSKQGLLGVEGMRPEAVLNALCKAGVLTEKNGVYFEAHNAKNGCGGPADCSVGRQSKNAGGIDEKITTNDLYELGLTGAEGAGEKRAVLLKHLGFPQNLSIRMMLEALNRLYTRGDLEKLLNQLKI